MVDRPTKADLIGPSTINHQPSTIRVTILGSGTSHGVPSVGCGCRVCCSPDPRDHRTRCGIVIQPQTNVEALARAPVLLVDAPPELRLQVVRSHVKRVDAVLFTHSHADHIFGLDDVRRYNEVLAGDLPVYARPDVLADLERTFRYVFVATQAGGGKPKLALTPIEGDCFVAAGVPVEAIPIYHGKLPITAFRIGRFAYVTDVSRVPEESMARLQGLDLLILGALRVAPTHPTHFTIGQALEVVEKLRPHRTYLTHLTHDVSHRETEAALPPGVRLAYDGLVLETVVSSE